MKDNAQVLKREKAIMALLSEPTIRQAAVKAGVSEVTIYRWLQDKEFNEAFKNARKMTLSQTIARLQQSTTEAVETLRTVMGDEEAPASSRVSAAKTVLDTAFKAHEMEDLVAQVEEMQRYIKELKAARK